MDLEFTFELATPADDPAIRRLLANNAVPGSVTLTYEREPDYFRGCEVMGPFCQILVARHQPGGEVVAVASRSTRPLFINGQEEVVGYLGQLRVDEHFRGRWLVSGGFRLLHHLHADGRTAGYITTIIEGNTEAQGLLVHKARRHFPVYREVDRLCTVAIILQKPFWQQIGGGQDFRCRGDRPVAPTGNTKNFGHTRQVFRPFRAGEVEISPATLADLPAIIAFFQRHGPAKQFFPVYTEADFISRSTTLGFRIEDFLVARCQHQIVGVIGLWDQSGYKQTVIRAYNDRFRPFYNIGLRLIGAQPLPSPGQPLHFAYASFICIADNSPDIFRLLLRGVYNVAAVRGYAYLMVGLAVRDPLLAVARQYRHIPYYSRLYTVCWKGEEQFHDKLDPRLPYIEIATL